MPNKLYNPGYDLSSRMETLSEIMSKENLSINTHTSTTIKEMAMELNQQMEDYESMRKNLVHSKAELLKAIDSAYYIFEQCYHVLKSIAKKKPEIRPLLKELSRFKRKSRKASASENQTQVTAQASIQ